MANITECEDINGQEPIFGEGVENVVILVLSIKAKSLWAHYRIDKNEDLYRGQISLDSLKRQLLLDYEVTIEQIYAEDEEGNKPDFERVSEFNCGTTHVYCFNSPESGFFEDSSQRAKTRIVNDSIAVEVQSELKSPMDYKKALSGVENPFDIPPVFPIPTRPKVTVAVIDSGIDYSNEHLRALDWIPTSAWTNYNCSYPYNFGIDFTGNYNPKDSLGHGTHVAGIISGNAERSLRDGEKIDYPTAEIDLKLMNLKVGAENYSLCNLVCAVHYAIENKADIINISLGYYVKKVSESGQAFDMEQDPLFQAIKKATRRGILVVAAAGNAGVDLADPTIDYLHLPSGFCNALSNLMFSVGSTKGGGSPAILAKHSNYGNNEVNITAPGNCILSSSKDSSWERLTGTSMAAAQISRVASEVIGLSRKYGEELTLLEIIDRVLDASKQLGPASIPKITHGVYL